MITKHYFLPVRVVRSGASLHLGYYEVDVCSFWTAVQAITAGDECPCVEVWWTSGNKSYFLSGIEEGKAFNFRSL